MNITKHSNSLCSYYIGLHEGPIKEIQHDRGRVKYEEL